MTRSPPLPPRGKAAAPLPLKPVGLHLDAIVANLRKPVDVKPPRPVNKALEPVK